MNKKELKCAIDNIQPDIYLKSRLAEKVKSDAPKRSKSRRRALSIGALCLVMAVTTVTVMNSKGTLINKPVQEKSSVETSQALFKDSFGIIIASASEPDKKTILKENVSTPLEYKLFLKDATGLNDAEKESEIGKYSNEIKMLLSESDFNSAHSGIEDLGDTLFGRLIMDNFDVEISDVNSVKSINIYNTSSFLDVEVTASGNLYDESGNFEPSKDFREAFFKGHNVNISGELYRKTISVPEATFSINLIPSEDLFNEVCKNPRFDLSSLTDTMTICVEYIDGTKASTDVNISFDVEGNMNVMLK